MACSRLPLIRVFPTQLNCKMAARWGTGEEMLKACNTQMFSPVNLDEVRTAHVDAYIVLRQDEIVDIDHCVKYSRRIRDGVQDFVTRGWCW